MTGERPRILAFAYACEPNKGSDPTAGWIWSRMLARVGETHVLTRQNNRAAIEQALLSVPERDQLRFVYVDLPDWARTWKRRQRGVRLYYLLWQLAALREARRLHRARRFDLVWHLTLSNAWLGSTAPLVGARFVYGPVGAGIGMPWRLLRVVGVRGAAYEFGRSLARGAGRYLNPLARLAWKRAALILVQNPETREWLPRRHRGKACVFPHVVLDENVKDGNRAGRSRTALFAGRLLPWKGAALAIDAIALAPDWRLRIYGSGRDSARLRRLAATRGVSARVEFEPWLPRNELLRVMREDADVFVFPSLHDEAGWVVVEALASGLRVICLDRGGPPVLIGDAGTAISVRASRAEVAKAISQSLDDAGTKRSNSRDQARKFALDAREGELVRLLTDRGIAEVLLR